MIKLQIKPLSANNIWKGRKIKTKDYIKYERIIAYYVEQLTELIKIPEAKKLIFVIRFGFSSRGSDVSNPIKATEDVLQNLLSYNDNQTYLLIAEKTIVPKGEEFFEFEFYSYKESYFEKIIKIFKK